MHELGIALELFKLAEEKARENNLRKITKVKVKLGEASGITYDFLKHSFLDHVFPGTIADGAVLEIAEEKVGGTCKDCKNKFAVNKDKLLTTCPSCGGLKWEITEGKEIYLDSIEGDEEDC